ncbi:MAG: hypothetical protein R2827_09105 [Bdellovibrionales bacterium]
MSARGAITDAENSGETPAPVEVKSSSPPSENEKTKTPSASKSSKPPVGGDKVAHYQKMVEQMDPIDTKESFDAAKIKEFNHKLRENEDPEEFKDQNEEKQAFVTTLFKEGKK